MYANKENAEVKIGANLADDMEEMKLALSIKEPNLILTQESVVKSGTLKNSAKAGFNNQDMKQCELNAHRSSNSRKHPQGQHEQKSVHSECAPEVNTNENTSASTHFQSSAKKQTSNTTTLLPVPRDKKLKHVITIDELCTEVLSILDQLTRDFFSESLSKILELPLNDTNIASIAYPVHKKATHILRTRHKSS
jgi:hypothetical protein